MGGAVGHIFHVFDNSDLTFSELKEILASAASGKLERVSEKLDGMNLVFTWDPSRRSLKVARSGGDIGRGGMGADALAAKFAGRGNVEEAFNSAFKVLEDAVGALQWRTAESVFGKNGNVWYSIEVIYTANPNAINYDSNNIVFHGWPIFEVQKDGAVARREDASGVDILSKNIERMQKAVSMRDWRVRGPSLVNLKKISDGSVLSSAVSAIDSALSTAGVSDDATIGEYLLNMMKQELEPLGLPPGVLEGTCMRALGFSGAPTVNDLKKKLTSKEAKAAVADAVKSGAKLQKKFVLPIEKAIQRFAVEVLRGLKSTLIDESDAEVVRLRSEVERAIGAIRASGDETAMSIVNAQLEKLGSVENISAAMEGVVFFYKGNAYKFTGAFAPASQILGILRYGRGTVKPGDIKSEVKTVRIGESLLRQLIGEMLMEMKPSEEMNAAEREAKAEYEAALNTLQYWDDEDKKRSAAYNRVNQLGVSTTSKKFTSVLKQVAQEPKYSYDAAFLKSHKREKLASQLDKAREEYALYEPSVVSYKRSKKPQATTDVQAPEKGAKSYADISTIKPLTWYTWNDPQWKNTSKIPYGVGDKKGDEQAGVGPGEARLAAIFGGKVQGGNTSFDIVTADGRKWEVKALERPTEHVRPGGYGSAVFEKALKRLDVVLNQAQKFVDVAVKTQYDSDAINYVKDFLDTEREMISRGEISPERLKALRTLLNVVAKIKRTWSSGKHTDVDTTITLAKKDVKVDKPTFIDVAKRVQQAVPNVDVLGGIKERELALSELNDPAFDDPAKFIDEWYDSIDIDKVFALVDGIFVVNSRGFNMVPKQLFKNAFKFRRVSQTRVRFEFIYY